MELTDCPKIKTEKARLTQKPFDLLELLAQERALDMRDKELAKEANGVQKERVALYTKAIENGFVWQSTDKKWINGL
jgi:hypothetical protein